MHRGTRRVPNLPYGRATSVIFCNVFMLFLTEYLVVSLALICSFSRMRTHLGLGDAKPEDVPEDTVMAVAETLRTSSFLKISEDGEI